MTFLTSVSMLPLLILKMLIKNLLPNGIPINTKLIEFWLKKSSMIFHKPMKFSLTKTSDLTTTICSKCNTQLKMPIPHFKSFLVNTESLMKRKNNSSLQTIQNKQKTTTEYWEFQEMRLLKILKRHTENYR